MATLTQTSVRGSGMTSEEKFVIFASSLGTIFEWYDFYLYGVLAPFIAVVSFLPGRPQYRIASLDPRHLRGRLHGASVRGNGIRPRRRSVGRKYTFLVTIVIMGASTFLVGLLPTFAQIGWIAPILLVTLRLCQGWRTARIATPHLVAGGTSRPDEASYTTSFIQTTATLGFFLALIVIGSAASTWRRKCSRNGDRAFRSWSR